MKEKRKQVFGFTLVELLVVIAIRQWNESGIGNLHDKSGKADERDHRLSVGCYVRPTATIRRTRPGF